MRILSWNVNGLTACLKKGFVESIMKAKPDVVCIQETRINEKIHLDIPYNQFWNFAEKKGYAGVAVFTKYNPLAVSYGLGCDDFDDEGRIITLEFRHFYLVNVYVPNSQGSLNRFRYRDEFDAEFLNYIKKLQELKPIVICGDFNVAHRDIDVYPENETNNKNAIGFETQERTNFNNLLDEGFVDVFRINNPDKIEYSWWSNRLNKRFQNKGWRIDYFLITATIQKYVVNFEHLNQILGSDHCPLLCNINHNIIGVDKISDEELTMQWKQVDWDKAEDELLDMQQKLTKAVFTDNEQRREEMQKKIVRSRSAKLLAVRHVTETSSGPGIDGVKWVTPAEKMRAALTLTASDYKAQPCRHIVIQSKNRQKERRISIPTMYDRAMQVLYAYALAPIEEAKADRKSFAFRKGRSLQDVHAYIVDCLSGSSAPQFVLIADVKSCYNSISHAWLLENIPMDKYVLKEFLKAGFIFAGSLFPSEQGISLGANISPILGNMTLDGMQRYIFANYYGRNAIDFTNGNMIRFADDILVTAHTYEDAEKFKKIIADFLFPRGLKLSEEKTKIVDTREGFDFLSRHYLRRNNIIFSTPSTLAVERFEGSLKDLISTHNGSQQTLIEAINKKLTGFASYHKVTEATEAFKHIDVTVNALLLELCIQKHPKQPRKKLIDRYWYRRGDGEFVYAVKDKIECQVLRLSDVMLVNHKKIKTNANPYLELEYFESRDREKNIINIAGKYKAIWQRQDGKCYYCGRPILPDQQRMIVTINAAKSDSVKNLAYIHAVCKEDEFEYRTTSDNDIVLHSSDIMSLLYRLKKEEVVREDEAPSAKLKRFFLETETTPLTLTFDEIESIMEAPICKSGYNYSAYWYNVGEGAISHAWTSNGYKIQHLHIQERYIVFRKEDTSLMKLRIPEIFIKKKIPKDAKYEIENYLEFIRKKYGL